MKRLMIVATIAALLLLPLAVFAQQPCPAVSARSGPRRWPPWFRKRCPAPARWPSHRTARGYSSG